MDDKTADPLRLLVHGASGRMGQALLRLGGDIPGCRIVAGVSGGRPGQRVVDGIPQFAATELAGAPQFDVAIDFSLGVAVLSRLVEQAAAALPEWDCDIVESHHARKVDAPSGTALALGEVAGAAGAEPRYASVRAGDIVGEHLVQFTGAGERLELVHRASSRDVFARGALHAARRLNGRAPGRYGLRDLLT